MTPVTPKLTRQLPPRPPRTTSTTRPVPPTRQPAYINSGDIKATEVRITLEDGTVLHATGGHAADVYSWLMDCERYCASHPGTIAPYLGPKLIREDPTGAPIPAAEIKQGGR